MKLKKAKMGGLDGLEGERDVRKEREHVWMLVFVVECKCFWQAVVLAI